MTVITKPLGDIKNGKPANKLAEEVLAAYWDRDLFPVDPVQIASRNGLKVLETSLPEDVSGALIKEEGKDPVIVIEASDSTQRKRFSCAHELGHYFRRVSAGDVQNEYEYVDFRDSKSKDGDDAEEIFANQFAANLLMPEKEVKSLWRGEKSALYAKRFFGVSESAMSYRLKTLRLV